MKPIYNVWILLFCLTFSSCYDEDIIDPTPDPLALAGGIEFPQGAVPAKVCKPKRSQQEENGIVNTLIMV